MQVTIKRLDLGEFLRDLDDFLHVFMRAMNYGFDTYYLRHGHWTDCTMQRGFKAFGAFVTAADFVEYADSLDQDYEPSGRLEWIRCVAHMSPETPVGVGIVFGFNGSTTQYWNRALRRGLEEQEVPEEIAAPILADYFEVAEMHVDPMFQGGGLGEYLMCKLLFTVPNRYVLLSTPEVPDEDNRAFRLYRRLGFEDLLRGLRYEVDHRPFAILMLDLTKGLPEYPRTNASN